MFELEEKYGYSGACIPDGGKFFNTFSVGIFRWIPTWDGKRRKKGKVLVRVKGKTSEPDKVYAKAKEIISLLESGKEYNGSKHITI